MHAAIKAISYYLPPGELTNEALHGQFPEWSVEKIARKTGILNRHIAADDVCASDLGVESARRLFEEHAIDPASVDFLLFCTQSPDYFLPTTACLVQERLGIPTTAGALDFNLGCSGFVYGLSLARSLVESGDARNVLLITAETYSKFIDPKDKSVRTIFGDGAAATLIGPGSDGAALGPFVFGTDGAGGPHLIVPTGGTRKPRSTGDGDSLFMDGSEVFNFTLHRIPRLVEDVLKKSELAPDDVDLYVFHQANHYVLEALSKKMKLPAEKVYEFMSDCGNTVSATIPIALSEALSSGRVRPGSRVMLVGFGVGYSWAGCIARL
jgi:3-oxoacyl-[acyl-carrier-protein] synthase-3